MKEREWLTDRGIATDFGHRDFNKIVAIKAAKTSETERKEREGLSVIYGFIYAFRRGRGQTDPRDGEDGRHSSGTSPDCPERVCVLCEGKGHSARMSTKQATNQNRTAVIDSLDSR